MSLWTVASGEALFSLKVFINYSFSFIYLITFIYYCLNRIKILDTILYSFGMAGPLVGLIATGYKITGQNMLQNALGLKIVMFALILSNGIFIMQVFKIYLYKCTFNYFNINFCLVSNNKEI